jgi:D-psicose/D-tagatose/L-ribulose 3-epimerase
MRIGASTFIWVSPFSAEELDLIDRIKSFGFDLIEICVEDPATIDTALIRRRLEDAQLGVTVCGAFGPNRDMSSEDDVIRDAAIAYTRRCVDIAAELGSDVVVGPMYAAVGATRMLTHPMRRMQWFRAVNSIFQAADYADKHGVRLAIEPLNRFETDLINTVDQGIELIADIERANVGLLMDTFHMNIEEINIPDAIRRAGKHLFAFHASASDRGTPGRDHLPWPEIVTALHDVDYRGPVVIEAFNPRITEIAKAVSLWRPLAESEDALAEQGLRHLRQVFG